MTPVFAVLAIGVPAVLISVFAFVSIASWSDARRREREAFYRSETIKKIAESTGLGAEAALEVMRSSDRLDSRRRLEGQKLGGLITAATGLGLMIFLRSVAGKTDEPIYLVGVIPLLIGLALLGYTVALAPKD